MARVGELDIKGARILNRDFAGEKFGPQARQFSIEITDPEMQEDLTKDGLNLRLYPSNVDGEPPRAYLNVRVDFRYGDVDIAAIDSDGTTFVFNENNVQELDRAWIKDSEMHILLNSYERPGRKGVTAYCKTLIVWLMSPEEQEQVRSERPAGNPVRDKYKDIFDRM